MKKIFLVILIAGLAWSVERLVTLDSRIQDHLAKTLTFLAGVPVTVDSLELSILSGAGSVTGLTVANPKGYSDASAFEMGSISFDVDILSAIAQPLLINTLVLDSPLVNLEVKDDLNSNLQEIIGTSVKQSKETKAKTEASSETEEAEQSESETEQDRESQDSGETKDEEDYFRSRIELLEFRNVRLKASRGSDSWEDAIEIIRLENLGGEEGLSSYGLGVVVVTELTGEVLAQAAKRSLTDVVEDAVKDLGQSILESLNKD